MSDPLLLLRAALSTGATITLHAGPSLTSPQVYTLPLCTHIALPSSPSSPSSPAHIFPKDTPTRYLTAPSATTSFDLQTLLLAYLHRELGTGDYFKQAREASSGFVGIIDRKSVVEWLSGKTALEGVEERIVPLISSEKRAATDSSTTGGEGGKSGSVQKKARYVVDKGDQERVARMMSLVEGPSYATVRGDSELKYERTGGAVINRESVLRGDRINNFETARILVGPRLKIARALLEAKPTKESVSASTSAGTSQSKSAKKKQRDPIIMISPSSTALITMYNVKKFLEESKFETSEEARLASLGSGSYSNSGRSVEDVIVVNHARLMSNVGPNGEVNSRKVRFFVVDGVEALSKFGGLEEAWDRVVCVMTTGQEWQFRPYKWTEPKELFHHVKGVFVQWTGEAPNSKVRSWNVTDLRIDPAKRHIDKSTVADFWRGLEGWIATNKPSLMA